MPFTFSHPAAVLPFCKARRIPVSVTGLIIGSMVPDFEFLFLLRESSYVGHSWPGIILYNIPAAVLSAYIFHYLIRNAFILHLPAFLRRRFIFNISFDWHSYFKKHYVIFFICVMAGVLSHIFIDAFTHKEGFMARPASFFQAEIKVLVFSLPVYFILQLLTSLAGGLYVLWYVLKMQKENDLQLNCRPLTYWLLFLTSLPCILLVRFTVTNRYNSNEDIIIAAAGSLLYALLFVSIIHYSRIKRLTASTTV